MGHKITQVQIGREGPHVFILSGGQRILELHWDAALMVAQAVTAKAREAEEREKAKRIIFDQALLIRAGARIGLTSHPAMLREAVKEAAWNSDLRRYLPGGIRSREIVGRPAVHGD